MSQQVQLPSVDERKAAETQSFARQILGEFGRSLTGEEARPSLVPGTPPRSAAPRDVPADESPPPEERDGDSDASDTKELLDDESKAATPISLFPDPDVALEEVADLAAQERQALQVASLERKEDPPGVTGLPGVPRRPEDFPAEKLLREFDDGQASVIDDQSFSVRGITDALGTVLDPHSGDQKAGTPEERARELSGVIANVIGDGFAFAQRSGDPDAIHSVLVTLAVAMNKFRAGLDDDEVGDQLQQTLDLVTGNLLPVLNSVRPFEDIGIQELLSIPSLTSNADELDQGNLGVSDIQAIQHQFGRDLVVQRLDVQSLTQLARWVDTNVRNGALRSVMTETIRERLKVVTGETVARRGVVVESPTTIRTIAQPLELTRLFDPLQRSLADLSDEANEEKDSRSAKLVNLSKIRNFAGQVNRSLDAAGFKDAAGQPLRVKVSSRERSFTGKIADLDRQIREFRSAQGRFATVSFRVATMRSRGHTADQQDAARVLADRTRFPTRNVRKATGHISHPAEIVRFGKSQKIRVSRSSEQPGLYEIVIEPLTPLGDIMSLAAALVKEPGFLQDFHGAEELEIRKGDNVHKVAQWIQQQFHAASGTDTHIVYKTTDPAGGLHVGGALRHAYAKPLFHTTDDRSSENVHRLMNVPLLRTTHFGGTINMSRRRNAIDAQLQQQHQQRQQRQRRLGGKVKVSDVSSGIAGVATGLAASGIGAPFALPVAAVSGIITGLGKIFGF